MNEMIKYSITPDYTAFILRNMMTCLKAYFGANFNENSQIFFHNWDKGKGSIIYFKFLATKWRSFEMIGGVKFFNFEPFEIEFILSYDDVIEESVQVLSRESRFSRFEIETNEESAKNAIEGYLLRESTDAMCEYVSKRIKHKIISTRGLK